MRNYWFKIAIGALAVFGLGMLIVTGVRSGKEKVVSVVQSADPITIPLAFVPFNVNGNTFGTMRMVRVERSAPDRVSAVMLRVKLADSVSDARLADCVLVVGGSFENVDKEQAFTCVPSADTTGKALERLGELETQAGGRFALYGPQGTLESIHLDFAEQASDSLAEAAAAQADSLAAEHEAMADSIERHVDSITSMIGPHVDSQVKAALEKARAARADARRRRTAVIVETPPPAPPAVPAKP